MSDDGTEPTGSCGCSSAPRRCSRVISCSRPDCTATATSSARGCCSTRAAPRASAGRSRDLCRPFGAQLVVSPALGGVIIGHEVGRALGVRAIFTEREQGIMRLRRGFTIAPGERVLVVEDVVTTGKSTLEAAFAVTAAGGVVVGLASIVDRSGGVGFPYPFRSLLQLQVATYAPEVCPLCREGKLPAIKPGSRQIAQCVTDGAVLA